MKNILVTHCINSLMISIMNNGGFIAIGLCLGLAGLKNYTSGSRAWITRKGKLGGKGFLSKPKKEQKRLLRKSVDKYGYRSTLGSIMALERSDVLRQRYGGKLESLRGWLRRTYGGEGSYK